MPDIKDVLAKAKRREHTVSICLAGDVAAEVERLEVKLADTSEWQPQSMADRHPGVEIAERITEARERMKESEVAFTFRALGAKAWSDLVAAHPGKNEGEPWDVETLAPALVSASAVDPEMSPDDVDELFEQLNFAQRQQLIDAAWHVNGDASIPFSLRASAILASHTGEK